MREMGIAGICPGPNLSKRTQKEGIFPYLLSHTTSQYPNHIWGLDITYIRGAWWLDVSRSCVGLVLAVCGELGTGPDFGITFCLDSTRTRPGSGDADHLQ